MITYSFIDNILHVHADTMYELTSSFMRMQEFYESPNPQFRGDYFTMDEYMDWYASQNHDKIFTYFEDWAGFNITGKAVIAFFDTFTNVEHTLRRKEVEILSHVMDFILNRDANFCIIGTYAGHPELFNHELRHAHYYLNAEYRNKCDAIYDSMPVLIVAHLRDYLLDWGYTEEVIADEIQAYFGSDTAANVAQTFDLYEYNIADWVSRFSEVTV